MLRLFNTLSRKIEDFKPLDSKKTTMYTCGPTVYDYTHIGHLKKYIGDDVLKKVLRANNYPVKHVMNITDVGHLTSDADTGEDKMEKGAKMHDMTVWEVAKFYEDYFFKSVDRVNIDRPEVVARATEHIKEQIKLIKKLEEKGYTYQTDEAIYFDVSKFPNYTKLSGQKLEEKEVGAREDVKIDKSKKHPADFALWFFTVGHFKDHSMKWPSPWGEGFPGWHIECSAMSMEYLGDTLDIHTGGVDHIPVHHTNEIAQSEAATGKQFVKYWIHHYFLNIDKEKMSKSLGNFLRLDEVVEKGYEPLSLRYLILTTHYRSELSFSWDSLDASQKALNNLRQEIRPWEQPKGTTGKFYQKFLEAVNNDLNTPQALAILWQMVAEGEKYSKRSDDLLAMDEILGLKLEEFLAKPLEIPAQVQKLIDKREHARQNKDFATSDKLRHEIKKLGYELEDTSTGIKIKKASL